MSLTSVFCTSKQISFSPVGAISFLSLSLSLFDSSISDIPSHCWAHYSCAVRIFSATYSTDVTTDNTSPYEQTPQRKGTLYLSSSYSSTSWTRISFFIRRAVRSAEKEKTLYACVQHTLDGECTHSPQRQAAALNTKYAH